MHTDRDPQPIEKVRQQIFHLKHPYWKESCGAEQHTQNCIGKERPHANEPELGEVVGGFVDNIASRIAKTEEAHVIHLKLEQLAEKQMSKLVNDDTRECECGDDGSGNKENKRLPYLGGACARRNFWSYSVLLMIWRVSSR